MGRQMGTTEALPRHQLSTHVGWAQDSGERRDGVGYRNRGSDVHVVLLGGVLEIARYKIESPGVLKGTYRGSIQGEQFEAECHLVKKLPNEWTFKTKGNKIGGKPKGELSVRFVRASENPRAKRARAEE